MLRAVIQYNMKSPTQLADAIVDRVEGKLKDLGRVPRDFVRRRGLRPVAWKLSCKANTVIGRRTEIKDVLASLRQHGAAVIWGGPGEGKSTIAMEAATQLRAAEERLSAFELDMQGERVAVGVQMTSLMLLPLPRPCCRVGCERLPCTRPQTWLDRDPEAPEASRRSAGLACK